MDKRYSSHGKSWIEEVVVADLWQSQTLCSDFIPLFKTSCAISEELEKNRNLILSRCVFSLSLFLTLIYELADIFADGRRIFFESSNKT